MIKVVAKAVYFQDKIERVKELFVELIKETKKEEGCITYELFQDVNDKSVLTIIEEWGSMEYLKKHGNSEHYMNIIPEIRSYRVNSDVNVYEKVF